MNINTTAEFVEDAETLKKLKEIGINFAQGFYIAQPIRLDKIIKTNQIVLENLGAS